MGWFDQRLPTASVGATIHVNYLSGALPVPENRVDNGLYLLDFSHWLKRLKRVPGIIFVP